MRILVRTVAALAAWALAACGGSDGGGTPCTKITGTWHLTDTRTSTSSTFCAQAITSGTSTVALSQTTASTFTWTETLSSGQSFVVNGQGSVDTCAANLTLSLSGTLNQPGYTLTLTGSRSLTFANNQVSGVSQDTLTTSPQQVGTPCTANFTTTGTR